MNESQKMRYWKDGKNWATDEIEVGQFICCPPKEM
jgi:hypothetical protein